MEQQRKNQPSPTAASIHCPLCRGEMAKSSESSSRGIGCLLFIIGLLLLFLAWYTIWGLLLAIPLILWSLHVGTKRRGLWVCSKCGHQLERKISWNELGPSGGPSKKPWSRKATIALIVVAVLLWIIFNVATWK